MWAEITSFFGIKPGEIILTSITTKIHGYDTELISILRKREKLQVNNKLEPGMAPKATVREGLIQKKKSVNFHTFGPDPPP